VADVLALVDLSGYERRRIAQLSGGQQQRVALARALAPEPRVLLLDEPLSNLDPTLRERTRREIRDLIRRAGATSIFVTHEQDEAFDLGDRVALLRRGRLEQEGTPEQLYAEPANAFVAGFVGRSSAVPVDIVGEGPRGTRVRFRDVEWEIPRRAAEPARPGPARLLARPEALWIAGAADGAVAGTVTGRRFAGASVIFTVDIGGGAALEVSGSPGSVSAGDRVGVLPSRRAGGGLHLFPREDA
jgi:ABC-type Fe3+/spermidine/putrescine transport system ATPase subunit